MESMGNPNLKWMIWGYPISWNLHRLRLQNDGHVGVSPAHWWHGTARESFSPKSEDSNPGGFAGKIVDQPPDLNVLSVAIPGS